MITVTRRIEFDAGHRVLGHSGNCRHLHGHRYVAEIEVCAEELDKLGFVIDFSQIKAIIGTWIDVHWDHNLLLNSDDPQLNHFLATEERAPFIFSENPTAENMARYLFEIAADLLSSVRVVSVSIHETPTCKAVYRP